MINSKAGLKTRLYWRLNRWTRPNALNSETNRSPCALSATPCGESTNPVSPQLRLELVGADALLGVRADARHDGPDLSSTLTWPLSSPTIGVVAVDDDRRRQQQIFGDHAEELPVERQVHDAIVGAVAGDEARRLEARVDRELVQRVEVVRRLLAAERCEVLAGLVEAVDVVAGVAVGDVDVAVGRDVHARSAAAPAGCSARSCTLNSSGIAAEPIVITMARRASS